MTKQEREELIEKMVRSMWFVEPDNNTLMLNDLARAALAVAEPVIREQCAKIADREANTDTGFETSDFLDGIAFGAKVTAAAIREGGNDE